MCVVVWYTCFFIPRVLLTPYLYPIIRIVAQCGSCVVQAEPLLLCYQLVLRLHLHLLFLLFFLLLVVTLQHGSFLKPHTLSSVQCLARIEPHIYFAHTYLVPHGWCSLLPLCVPTLFVSLHIHLKDASWT